MTKMLKEKKQKDQSKMLPDSDTSDEEVVNPRLRTSIEEREYGTIPESVLATHMAISHTRAQANPTIERGPRRKSKIKKLPKEKARDKATQMHTKDKDKK